MVLSWNEYFLPLLAINDEKQFPLTLGTMQFMGQYTQDWTLVLSFVTLTMIPVVIFYLIAERQIVSGLTAGALKG
jgi:raffinose/stachyose/melibiose transport system permease protein